MESILTLSGCGQEQWRRWRLSLVAPQAVPPSLPGLVAAALTEDRAAAAFAVEQEREKFCQRLQSLFPPSLHLLAVGVGGRCRPYRARERPTEPNFGNSSLGGRQIHRQTDDRMTDSRQSSPLAAAAALRLRWLYLACLLVRRARAFCCS